jgi:Ser/Thr protein kinase RdoA (MazF antagonist)
VLLQVSAVIDFGDMVYTELVHNVAIMLAYAMLGKADPLAAAVQVVAGCAPTSKRQSNNEINLFRTAWSWPSNYSIQICLESLNESRLHLLAWLLTLGVMMRLRGCGTATTAPTP